MSVLQTMVAASGGGLDVKTLRVDVIEGPDVGMTHVATEESMSVGSAPTNDLVLSDPTVSRYHLDLTRTEDGVMVLDHGSTNGTFLGGTKLFRAAVRRGSVLRIGQTRLKVLDGDDVQVPTFEGERLFGLVGRSALMRRLMARVGRVAVSDTSVLLLGETGTGKEVVARAIHEASPRASGPLETVDCGAILPTMLASELFGHEKGAFTGADQRHLGAFERAHGGTLFLDEIGELPSGMQTALLGALERRSFRRIGGKEPINVDVRVIGATHRDLREEVNTGGFRQDLYFRIAVVTLPIPSLRDRQEDIPLLAEHFLRRLGFEGALEEVWPADAQRMLLTHRWPGNVRELRNVVEATFVMGEAPELSETHQVNEAHERALGAAKPGAERLIALDHILDQTYAEARDAVLAVFEREYLEALRDRAGGNISEAARLAEMNRPYLSRLLKSRGLRWR
ncbi:MAG: sigma 54-dependent Fis family transcriptional regulator [Deltaproteobacteria bacterium]|nr:sigma 54-dependent Fis family transcriptional regulator [Deltaproteobacteria bacterium]